MQLYLLLCCVSRVTQIKCSSLHLDTLNSFKIDFKLIFTTKNRNTSTIYYLFSQRHHHSHNHRVERHHSLNQTALWFLVKCWLRNTENCSWPCNRVLSWCLCSTCTKSDTGLQTFWIVWTQWSVGCKTWNNDHHVHQGFRDYLACHVHPLLIDYINLWLTLAISCYGNFHMRHEETS